VEGGASRELGNTLMLLGEYAQALEKHDKSVELLKKLLEDLARMFKALTLSLQTLPTAQGEAFISVLLDLLTTHIHRGDLFAIQLTKVSGVWVCMCECVHHDCVLHSLTNSLTEITHKFTHRPNSRTEFTDGRARAHTRTHTLNLQGELHTHSRTHAHTHTHTHTHTHSLSLSLSLSFSFPPLKVSCGVCAGDDKGGVCEGGIGRGGRRLSCRELVAEAQDCYCQALDLTTSAEFPDATRKRMLGGRIYALESLGGLYASIHNNHSFCVTGTMLMATSSIDTSIFYYEAARELTQNQGETQESYSSFNPGRSRGRVGGNTYAGMVQLAQFYMLQKQHAQAVKIFRESVATGMQEMAQMDAIVGEASRLSTMCLELASALELSGGSDEARYYVTVALDISINQSRAACLFCDRVRSDEAVELLTCGACKVARYCCAAHQKGHWDQHKMLCSRWKRWRAARTGGRGARRFVNGRERRGGRTRVFSQENHKSAESLCVGARCCKACQRC